MQRHDHGQGSAYTSSRRPLRLLHTEEFESRYEALAMERKLKGWSHAKKLAYARGDWNAIRRMAKGKHKKA
jgi:predicted GIY-YIG superfamily endonuclease